MSESEASGLLQSFSGSCLNEPMWECIRTFHREQVGMFMTFFSTQHIEKWENKEKNTSMQKKCHPSGKLWRRCQLRKWDLRADAGVDVLLKKKTCDIRTRSLYETSCLLHTAPPPPPWTCQRFLCCCEHVCSEGTLLFFLCKRKTLDPIVRTCL